MAEDTKQTSTGSKKSDADTGKNDGFEQAKADTLTPEQKHQNYLDLLERLHNEP